MRVIHALFVIFYMSFVISCSGDVLHSVKYDFDSKVDFLKLKKYDWLPSPENEVVDNLNLNRVKKAVNADLQVKGLRMTSDNPDFFIAVDLGSKTKIDVKKWGYRRSYRGTDRVVTYQYEQGSLVLDFVDAKTKNLIWTGGVKADIYNVLTPEERKNLIKEAVRKVLVNFPPSPLQ